MCIVLMKTLTLEPEEPGKQKLINSMEAREVVTLADPIVMAGILKRYFSRQPVSY